MSWAVLRAINTQESLDAGSRDRPRPVPIGPAADQPLGPVIDDEG